MQQVDAIDKKYFSISNQIFFGNAISQEVSDFHFCVPIWKKNRSRNAGISPGKEIRFSKKF